MSKKEAPLEQIGRYIPAAAVPRVLDYLVRYGVHLTITRERRTILGDYRHATSSRAHRISVNGNLNPYSFLITLIHELAHLLTFTEFGNRVDPHGKEWKNTYAFLLKDFLSETVFPADLLATLRSSLHDLPASSCSDERLTRVLRGYDAPGAGMFLVEQLPIGTVFDAGKGKLFRRGKKLRKRYQCEELATGRTYLFSPVYEVKPITGPHSTAYQGDQAVQ